MFLQQRFSAVAILGVYCLLWGAKNCSVRNMKIIVAFYFAVILVCLIPTTANDDRDAAAAFVQREETSQTKVLHKEIQRCETSEKSVIKYTSGKTQYEKNGK